MKETSRRAVDDSGPELCAEAEAYALGRLDLARTREVRAHLARCSRCADEARVVFEERSLFVRRAALPAPAPPPFAAVLARARAGAEPGPRPFVARWTMLLSAAALLVRLAP